MAPRRPHDRAFVYHGGVRIAGTVVSCDGAAGGELVFLSHAPAPGAHGRRSLPRVGSGRRRLLATRQTLALVGVAATDSHALVAAPGRPFFLGGLRLEIFSSGYMPGAASLLCEHAGRRIVYAGPIGRGADVEVRAADALCLDGSGTLSEAAFPPVDAALAELGRSVRESLGAGRAPVLLVPSAVAGLLVGAALAADRVPTRAHRAVVLAAGAFRDAGLAGPPLARFAGRLGPGEVLLWPADEKPPPRRQGDRPRALIAVGPEPLGEDARTGPGMGPRLSIAADLAEVIRYVEGTGAREVAVINGPARPLVSALQEKGIDAYQLGPPRQAELFAA